MNNLDDDLLRNFFRKVQVSDIQKLADFFGVPSTPSPAFFQNGSPAENKFLITIQKEVERRKQVTDESKQPASSKFNNKA